MNDTQHDFWFEEKITQAEGQIYEESKKIDFYLTEYSIELLALKMRNGDFEIPNYQREFTWEADRKSRFIESIIMGLPIPFLFFWEIPKSGKLEIIDGSQRLRTIEEFILGDFKIGKLTKLPTLLGLRFTDLPESRQRKIKNRSIRGIVLNEHADDEARFDLFDRINTGSKIASPAEIRRGAVGGPFLDLVDELVDDKWFSLLAPVPEKQKKQREREELVTRFFAYSDGLDDYRDRVADFLFKYSKKMNKHFIENPSDIEVYRQRFQGTMSFVYECFPWGFRRKENGKTTPRARFEAIAVGSYEALQTSPTLREQNINVSTWLHSDEFDDIAGSDGANAIGRLRGRIEYVRDRLIESAK